jgi:hypothetical protein
VGGRGWRWGSGWCWGGAGGGGGTGEVSETDKHGYDNSWWYDGGVPIRAAENQGWGTMKPGMEEGTCVWTDNGVTTFRPTIFFVLQTVSPSAILAIFRKIRFHRFPSGVFFDQIAANHL